jgi:hypothetical protein
MSPRNAKILTTKRVAQKLLTFALIPSWQGRADDSKSGDAKESIHSMCDADYWALGRVEIKINGSGSRVRG